MSSIKKAWKRLLIVTLSSTITHSSYTFKDEVDISVYGNKYLATMKDECTVEISNLTYDIILDIINNKYYNIKIEAAYEGNNLITIFEGAVLYISNKKNDHNTSTCIILCSNKIVAQYGQSKMNLSLNSNINMYSAINYIVRSAGVKNANVSEELKKVLIKNAYSNTQNLGDWINSLSSLDSNILSSADQIDGNSILNIWNKNYSQRGKIKLDSSNILAISGYPRLSTSGIVVTVLPTYSFKIGDVIELDNSILDKSITNKEDVFNNINIQENNEGAKDGSSFGQYILYKMSFSLTNRDYDFQIELYLKNRSLYSSLVKGGE